MYNVSGQWTKAFDMYTGPTKKNSAETLIDKWDPALSPTTSLVIAPLEKQHPLESRRAWANVARGIGAGDMDFVGREKSKIENAQRAMRRQEREEGREWVRRYFTAAAEGVTDPTLEKYAATVGLAEHGDADKTGGLWRFDNAKAEKARAEGDLSEEEKAKIAKELLGQE